MPKNANNPDFFILSNAVHSQLVSLFSTTLQTNFNRKSAFYCPSIQNKIVHSFYPIN